MYQYIKVPKELHASTVQVAEVLVSSGERVRAGRTLLYLLVGDMRIPIISPSNGWVVFAHARGAVRAEAALVILDVSVYGDYRPDVGEVNPNTELGEAGRRGYERAEARKLGPFSKDLINPHQEGAPGQSPLLGHPLLSAQKNGTPPKMSGNAAENPLAIDEFMQNVHDPALQKQLSQELQQQLGNTLSRSAAPILTR